MRQTTILFALSALTVAVAQNFTVDPSTIDPGKRADWCNAQFNTCGILCGGDTKSNECTPTDLKYSCLCSNGTEPGLQYYIQSMPTLLCDQSFENCIAKNVGDSQAQSKCKTDIKNKCGTLDPAKVELGGQPAPSSSGGTSSPTGAAPTSATQQAAAPTMGSQIGNGIAALAAGIFAAALI